MSRWIVLVSPLQGVSTMNCNTKIVREVDGTEEEAREALLTAANTYSDSIMKLRRREVFRVSERSYFIRIQNRMNKYAYMVQLAELVSDSDRPDDAAVTPADAVPTDSP